MRIRFPKGVCHGGIRTYYSAASSLWSFLFCRPIGNSGTSTRAALNPFLSRPVRPWETCIPAYLHTGKPVNVSSIADMTGIPRPTVIRKLDLLEGIGLASRSETRRGTMVTMSAESWVHVRPHVARVLELETELTAASES